MRLLSHSDTLIYYDGPELIVSIDQLGVSFICLLIESIDNQDRYFCVPVSTGRLNLLLSGEIDLLQIFESSEIGEYYESKVESGNLNQFEIRSVQQDEIPKEWFPDPGFYIEELQLADSTVIKETQERHRAIIHCTLNPPEAFIEPKITADHLGQAVKVLQRVVRHAYNLAIRDTSNSNREMFISPSNYELEVFSFSPGSFTLHMQTAGLSDLFGYSNISKALEILDSINYEIEDPEKALEVISNYGGHLVTAYKDFLLFIIDLMIPFLNLQSG